MVTGCGKRDSHRIVYVVDETSIDLGTDLADLSDVLLDDLRTADDTPLAHSIRRILAESKDSTKSVVSGYESHI